MERGSDASRTNRTNRGATLLEVADQEALGKACASIIAKRLRALLARRPSVHLALSGGRSPVGAYERLGAAELPWERVELWFADERCVGPEDPQANVALVRQTLLAGPFAKRALLHRIEGERGPEQGARSYEALLRERVQANQKKLPVLDLVLLGIGEDGHIASLFPNHAALEEQSAKLCLPISDSPKPPPQRITLSLGLLRSSGHCLLLASGAAKARALARALAAPGHDAPVSLLAQERLCVLADRDATELLSAEAIGA